MDKINKLNEMARSFEQIYLKELKEILREPVQFYKKLWELYNKHFDEGEPTPLEDVWGNDDMAPCLLRGVLIHIIHDNPIPQWAKEELTVPVTEIIKELLWVTSELMHALWDVLDENQYNELLAQRQKYEEILRAIYPQGELKFDDLYEMLS